MKIISQSNLIAISEQRIDNENVQTVNARELHAFLEVGKMFANWINDRINQYGFVENQDYIVIANSGKNPNGGRPSKEYYISIDMAKELSMVERNEKGKQARRYFIECEKQAQNQLPQLPQDYPSALRLAADLAEQNEQLAIEKQQAIREKGQISNRREASVMGKLGAAVKKICKLETQVGNSEKFKQAKAISWLPNYFELNRVAYQQIGKKLTAFSEGTGIYLSRLKIANIAK